jgi:hypothetical protein
MMIAPFSCFPVCFQSACRRLLFHGTGPQAGWRLPVGPQAGRPLLRFTGWLVRRHDPPPLAGLTCGLMRGRGSRLIKGMALRLLMRGFSWSGSRFVQQVAADDQKEVHGAGKRPCCCAAHLIALFPLSVIPV